MAAMNTSLNTVFVHMTAATAEQLPQCVGLRV